VTLSTILDKAYRNERDANIKERILLVRRIISDGQDIEVVSKELHRSRAWAYKWFRIFDKEGLDRTGRPPSVPQEKLLEIKRELSDNPSGWKAKEIMNIVHKRTGVRYHEVHIYRLLHKWGFSPKVPRMRFVNATSKQEKDEFRKRQER
jgi:putative transposase